MDHIIHGLNRAQREAVTSSAAVLQVLAPPGSGKTKTLTARVAYLLAEHQLKPWSIIVCTFTVKAASEMKERIRNLVGDELAKQLKLGTFHSIAVRYLRQYGQHIGLAKDFGIVDTSDSKAIVKRIIKNNDYSIDAAQARSRISAQKAKGIQSEQFGSSAKQADQQEFAHVYSEYESILKASNLLDYDDLLLRCCSLIRNHPQCVSHVEAVLIDEFQDTNTIQYDLMGLFARKRNNITIVGDPDQSIYGFRSAEIKNLSQMCLKWPDTLTINLEENYRSSGAILHAAQNIIEQDQSRPPKKLQATHSPGLRPILRKLPSAGAEAEWLVSEVKRMRALTGEMLRMSDFAVLLRSASLSRLIEAALGKAGVPYRMVGGPRFYDRAEIRLILDYLRVIDHAGNSEALHRVLNVPARRIGEATIKALMEEAQSKDRSLWRLVLDIAQGRYRPKFKLSDPTRKGLAEFVNIVLTAQQKLERKGHEQPSLIGLINLVIQKLDFQKYLKLKYPDDCEARWTNVEELLAQASALADPETLQSIVQENALPSVEGFEQSPDCTSEDLLSIFLANIALTASSEKKAAEDGETIQELTISTIHAAKGLEWPIVFIPACYDGSIPHSRADDHDEERRLLYVGMTRAEAALYLSCPMKDTQRQEAVMSTFLQQPGVSTFFEEHGPSISLPTVGSLASRLGRNCPPAETLERFRRTLETDEDNYWPTNGEEPLAIPSQKNTTIAPTALSGFRPASTLGPASITQHQQGGFPIAPVGPRHGFVSVASRYEELMDQSALRKVDNRVEEGRRGLQDKLKREKRRQDGQGTITSFFTKRPRRLSDSEGAELPEGTVASIMSASESQSIHDPLKEISRTSAVCNTAIALNSTAYLPQHKLRSASLRSRPPSHDVSKTQEKGDHYVFLSSSPQKPDDPDDGCNNTRDADDAAGGRHDSSVQARAAATFHTTTMQSLGSQRKTLGMRRSLHGWSSRGRGR